MKTRTRLLCPGSAALLALTCQAREASLTPSLLQTFFQRSGGRISYVGIDGNVYVTDQKGSEEVMLTGALAEPENVPGSRYWQPAWSPDGRWISALYQ